MAGRTAHQPACLQRVWGVWCAAERSIKASECEKTARLGMILTNHITNRHALQHTRARCHH